MLQNQRPTLWTFDGTCKTCKKSCYKIKDRHFGLLMGLVKLVKNHATKSKTGHLGHLGLTCKTCKKPCYKIKDRHFGTFDGTCKTCKKSCYKIKDRHFGLLMGLVKLVKNHATKSKTNKKLYRIDSNQNLYRIVLEVFTKKKIQHMFT